MMPDELRIEADRLTLDDLETLDRAGAGDARWIEVMDLLDRVIEGGARGKDIPLTQLPIIVERISEAVSGLFNPEVRGKN